jgi:Tfp pilus assembly protein PilF
LSVPLGYLGLGETKQATDELNRALALNPAHVGARSALASLKRP